jgi:hypothetical protein
VNYIENLFSTYLYTGNGSTQTITNGINLSANGGLVWNKGRSNVSYHDLIDTVRGADKALYSNTTDATATSSAGSGITSFNSDGFTFGTTYFTGMNESGVTSVAWTFRKQPKFFDVVTYTGNGAGGGQVISHNLGSTPGLIICKSISAVGDWAVCARTGGASSPVSSITYATGLSLNSTGAALYSGSLGNYPTSTTFDTAGIFDNPGNYPNSSGVTYVAYLFAHNAGGFGLTGTDNVISCGSYTTVTSPVSVNLGYEPQWLLVKRSSGTGDWRLADNMRGWSLTQGNILKPNLDVAEADAWGGGLFPTATGFTDGGVIANNSTMIYIAIRKGPMAVPTVGTSVFSPIQAAGSTGTKLTTNFPVDLQIWALPADGGSSKVATDRLRGVSTNTTTSGVSLYTDLTDAENNASNATRYFDNTGYTIPGNFLGSGYNAIYWNFKRAPGFFDEVCYTGTGANRTVTHNLAAVPELMIVKSRTRSPAAWYVYNQASGNTKELFLNSTGAIATNDTWNNTTPTSSVFSIDNSPGVNDSGHTYVAYLFATCAGVSKVGSYTGNNADGRIIDCGFTTGARFVLIRRTDQAGHWAVWDSARGITSGNDPYLMLNNTIAEVTGFNDVGTTSTGFTINATSPGIPVNVAGSTYIFLAIA